MSFESSSEIERKREDLRRARHLHLEKAKNDFEKEEKKKERAKARGEDTWMLASVNQRIEQEQQSLKKPKKKKKEKKKTKKKKKRQSSSSSDSESDSEEESKKKRSKKKKKRKKDSSSSSSSDSDNGSQWVEKSARKDPKPETSATRGPKLERDSWMSAPPELFPTVTRQDLINCRKKEKEEQDRVKDLLNKPGTHAKELNPYWKGGEGTGLPDEEPEGNKERKERVGDAGLSWLKKSYERCVEQAKEEGQSLEELAAERWGSLEKIQSMIREAEIARFGRPRTGDQRKKFMKPTDSDNTSEYRNSKSSSSSYNSKRSRSPERSRFQRPRSSSRERKDRSRSRERRHSRSRSRSQDRYRSRDYRSSASSSQKGRFMKPGDDSGEKRRETSSNSSSRAPAWRKKEFQKPDEDKEGNDDKPRERRRERRKSSSSSSSDSSSSADTSSESASGDDGTKRKSSAPQQPPVRILTEKEMNDLGAKIVKAEILGNEELAAKLKAQLESAREARKTAPQGQGRVGGQDDEEEDVVTLTRTGRSGMARPVPEGQHPVESGSRRRRKKQQKVETHTGKEGERTKYFDDDDKHDLKSLVEREKMGTAEDQNQMFARLAGRAAERTDDDFQVDDIILSKADRKQSEAVMEQRDRASAIFEHKKMATAMEKCNFCFGKVSKHLIIAIGQKVYLSLPPHQSLTEGHCLIVPMQHVTSSTVVDEDVWSEIQLFRKTLTRMFTEKDEDVVFMETSMRLKHFPHMCIECVPIEKEVGDMAPIYFKKAIQDSESEWSQNKKVVDLRHKDIRHSVPKGFPYFSVDFGNEGGFAHVIEDEQKFPHYFGREIIGGMVDADHRLWKKPPRENFDDQRRKVMKFAEMWKPYDWTQNIDKKVNEDPRSSSSDSDD